MNNDDPMSKEAQALHLGKYRHFKDHDVIVLGVARHSENPKEEFVVYKHDGKFWVRPLMMFLENVKRGKYVGPRFVWTGEKI